MQAATDTNVGYLHGIEKHLVTKANACLTVLIPENEIVHFIRPELDHMRAIAGGGGVAVAG